LVQQLGQELGIGEENIFQVQAPLNLTSLHKIADLDFPDLKFAPFRSRTAKALSEVESGDLDMFFASDPSGRNPAPSPIRIFYILGSSLFTKRCPRPSSFSDQTNFVSHIW